MRVPLQENVFDKLNTKADKNDLNSYLKLDGTSQMQGHLQNE